jgi:class 3 adenylate cyclase/predicted ATPase
MDVTCGVCGQVNDAGRKFCGECGSPLTLACGACGTPNPAGTKFCGECGASLTEEARPAAPAAPPQAERRLVSVLFADLVGFTTASEGRDAEDTRELLTRYFDLARTTIERYGGTVEKFIGDAVMAVWGAPVATEDDAERAVRAALELVDAIPTLDAGLHARVGVLTGEAAVTLGATDQGMVAGDLVNTAARIQAAAQPGTVLVGDTTHRATGASIAYVDAGAHELRGKSEPVPLFRAERAASRPHDEDRAGGLEAPFVGRAGELRVLKDLFHASVDEARARLVSVVGVAGIGKSRLSREFEKHVEGLATQVWWHRGRCLSYGDGVAYWALAEMVRARSGIVENEEPLSAGAKLRSMVAEHVADPTERAWVEPRLLHLLGLTDRSAPDREDLFAAWRRFFERLAENGPLVMVFEDLHWADEGLLAFVDYLLDWARHHPIFVLTLSRPELADRHPGFPGSTRSATTLPLDPLDDDAMDQLLTGLVPGLPDDVRARLREAADGIPLYAVETVRMLRDRGILDGDVAIDEIARLEVPETLHALIAARLDALPKQERLLLQDAAVLGKTFTSRGLSALSGLTEDAIQPLVADLVRKELLGVETDPFSAERGQLGFLQALVQRVAYETTVRRERRRRHMAAARFLASDAGLDPDEIAEVIATHYLDAYEAEPDADDREEVRAEARVWFTRAAERAASLAASLEAQRAHERAADLTGDDVERGRSLARAGELAAMGGRIDEAESLLEEAIAILAAADLRSETAAAQVRLGEVMFVTGRGEEAIARLESALAAHEAEADEVAVATVSAELSRALYFEARPGEALEHAERALDLAERLQLDQVVVQALMNKALVLEYHPNERLGLVRQALALAEESSDDRGALRACMNLSYLLSLSGRSTEAVQVVERGIALARRRGERIWERNLTTNLVAELIRRGSWDDAERAFAEAVELSSAANPVHAASALDIADVALRRGDDERVVELTRPFAVQPESANIQQRHNVVLARLLVATAEGRHGDVVTECLRGLRDTEVASLPMAVEDLTDIGGEAAHAAGSAAALAEIVALARTPGTTFHVPAARKLLLHVARIAALEGASEPRWDEAVAALRGGEPYWLGTALLEQAEWLLEHGRVEEAPRLLGEAREIFERLRAAPRLDRLAGVEARLAEARVPA